MSTTPYTGPTASVNAVRPGRTHMRNFDLPLVLAAMALLMLGLLMVYSASIAPGDGPRYSVYGHYYFITRHAIFLVIGLMAALVALTIPVSPNTAAGGRIRGGDSVEVVVTTNKGRLESKLTILLPRITMYDVGED